MSMLRRAALSLAVVATVLPQSVSAQELLPYDNGIDTYHTAPRYRESESHPLRIVAYALHPIGWVLREVIFRPLSYFAASTPETRSVMGYREPYDYRKPSCFSSRDITPDCRQIVPFNYESQEAKVVEAPSGDQGQAVYFPDTNFDFNARTLNELGRSKVKTVAAILGQEGGVKVVLEGHTDKRGGDKYNDKLGLDRAEAVKGELVKLGIPAADLSTVSFGETRPLFNEDAEWAYAANRRVEVHIGGKGQEVATAPNVASKAPAAVKAPAAPKAPVAAKVPDAPPAPVKAPASAVNSAPAK